jgi:hypothetical protein
MSELSSKRFQVLALECQQEARLARSTKIPEGLMHVAMQWLKPRCLSPVTRSEDGNCSELGQFRAHVPTRLVPRGGT